MAIGSAVVVGAVVAIVAIRASHDKAPTEPPTGKSYVPTRPSAPSAVAVIPRPDAGALLVVDGGIVGAQVFDTKWHPGDGPLLRPMDKEIFEYIASGKVAAGVTKDAFPKEPYRVQIERQPGDGGLVTNVLVDLNRNGKWDEIWSLTADSVRRKYSEKDDNSYDRFTELAAGRWRPLDR